MGPENGQRLQRRILCAIRRGPGKGECKVVGYSHIWQIQTHSKREYHEDDDHNDDTSTGVPPEPLLSGRRHRDKEATTTSNILQVDADELRDRDEGVAEEGGGFRFKYRSVPANSYGLTDEEVLLADPAALNAYVSLRRLAPYREKEWCVVFV